MTKSVFVYFILIVAIGATSWALFLKGGGDTDMDVLNATESPMAEEESMEEGSGPETVTLDNGLQYQELTIIKRYKNTPCAQQAAESEYPARFHATRGGHNVGPACA